MMPPTPTPRPRTVYLVDDDASVRDSLSLLLSLNGFVTAVFASAEDFLQKVDPSWRGCVVADIRMSGMTGLQMQNELVVRDIRLPVVIITAHGDIDSARQAFRVSAVDFLEKPFDQDRLLAAIERGFGQIAEAEPAPAAPSRPASLSRREREVMQLIVAGLSNQRVGEELGISPRTVEVHKSRIMAKVGAKNLADLIRMTMPRA
jgi:FixJ family two-component response regulator